MSEGLDEIKFYCLKCERPVLSFATMAKYYTNWGFKYNPNESERLYCEKCRREVFQKDCYKMSQEILEKRFDNFKIEMRYRLEKQLRKFWIRDWKGNTKIKNSRRMILCPFHKKMINISLCDTCKHYDGEGYGGESKCRYFHQLKLN